MTPPRADEVSFRIYATAVLTPYRPLHVEAWDEACEKFSQAANEALDAVVEEYADLGGWLVTVEGTQ